ncbi:MAG: hypothetical protein ACJAUJ_001738, partial [Salibacteraceae bacterium]
EGFYNEDCIIDIGAHIDTFSIPFARFVGIGGWFTQ